MCWKHCQSVTACVYSNGHVMNQAGDLVWRNKDPAVEAQARASYESLSSAEMRKVPVDASVSGFLGQV